MEASGMTQAALLDALRAAVESGVEEEAGALTGAELREELGLSEKRLQALLREMHAAGRVEVTRVTRTNIVGAVVKVPAYRLKQTGKNLRAA